ncbi:MAG TPA: hypothetical protein VLC98_08630 [Phnomibacter sp.]|nr:hypothetical protein [Phnomibacter sp.]
MDKYIQKLLATVLGLCLAILVQAQVAVRVNRNNIYIGQPIQLHITMDGPNADSVVLGDSIGRFDILQKNAPLFAKGQSTQVFTITCYDSGHYLLPPISTAVAGLKGQLSDSIFVDKMPADSLTGYGDVKTLYTNTPSRNWLSIVLFTIAGVIISLLLWWFLRKYFRAKKLKVQLPINGPDDWHREMKKLQQNWNDQKLDARMAATEHMVLIRSLLQLKGIANPALTGEELMQQAEAVLPNTALNVLHPAVQDCYQIQFAKHQPSRLAFAQSLQQVEATATALFSSSSTNNAAS